MLYVDLHLLDRAMPGWKALLRQQPCRLNVQNKASGERTDFEVVKDVKMGVYYDNKYLQTKITIIMVTTMPPYSIFMSWLLLFSIHLMTFWETPKLLATSKILR